MDVWELDTATTVRPTNVSVWEAPCSCVRSRAQATSGTTQAARMVVTTAIATTVRLAVASVTVALRWCVSRPARATSGATSTVPMAVPEAPATPVSPVSPDVLPERPKSVV